MESARHTPPPEWLTEAKLAYHAAGVDPINPETVETSQFREECSPRRAWDTEHAFLDIFRKGVDVLINVDNFRPDPADADELDLNELTFAETWRRQALAADRHHRALEKYSYDECVLQCRDDAQCTLSTHNIDHMYTPTCHPSVVRPPDSGGNCAHRRPLLVRKFHGTGKSSLLPQISPSPRRLAPIFYGKAHPPCCLRMHVPWAELEEKILCVNTIHQKRLETSSLQWYARIWRWFGPVSCLMWFVRESFLTELRNLVLDSETCIWSPEGHVDRRALVKSGGLTMRPVFMGNEAYWRDLVRSRSKPLDAVWTWIAGAPTQDHLQRLVEIAPARKQHFMKRPWEAYANRHHGITSLINNEADPITSARMERLFLWMLLLEKTMFSNMPLQILLSLSSDDARTFQPILSTRCSDRPFQPKHSKDNLSANDLDTSLSERDIFVPWEVYWHAHNESVQLEG